MKCTINENNNLEISEVYTPLVLKTNANEKMVLTMRDSGFEFMYNNKWYEAKNGEVHVLGENINLKDKYVLDKMESATMSSEIENGVDEEVMVSYLATKFTACFGVESVSVKELWFDILSKYKHHTRFYHNIEHLYDMGQFIDKHNDKLVFATNRKIVWLALFFHDYYYSTFIGGKSNEYNSMSFAAKKLTEHGFDFDVIKDVMDLIMLTETHNATSTSATYIRLFIDADMMILASDPAKYDKYRQGVTKEYLENHTREAFIKGRIKFLNGLLTKRKIFLGVFEDEEEKARKNILEELKLYEKN